ncbi:hypothetical protein KVR01_012208 [Diaporthe batatas]|uniref:uncharacterized protein n=1 Tax=Diaporthe batatas TaxID=748121 RepID=UPI001D04CB5C|nr:uncharacterized protein KVR01_012208 [Diaporthe batatas]KAG8157936.1 hypothetical protein KVR01_012208 [Diaporthe batatas]
MALDSLILVLPIPLLFSSNTVRKTRLGLVGLFIIGAIINVIAAGRIVANRATSDEEPDPTRSFPAIILLGETENRLSLALASIPVFWPVVTKTWSNFIFVTHEFKVERTTREFPNRLELGDVLPKDQAFNGVVHINTEDEATEAGLRHPGRLCEVDQYIRHLISPFSEAQNYEVATWAREVH